MNSAATASRVSSSSRAQSGSDQHVLNEAGRRRRLQATGERKAALPALLAVAGLLGALAWWRRSRGGKADGRRPGKAPRSAVRQAKPAPAEASNLPRNKAGNNKKNKERKRAERERRAEKRESEGGRAGPSDPGHKEEADNTIVLTSKFVDATPRTVSNLPKAQRMGQPGGGAGDRGKGSLDPAVQETLSRKAAS